MVLFGAYGFLVRDVKIQPKQELRWSVQGKETVFHIMFALYVNKDGVNTSASLGVSTL